MLKPKAQIMDSSVMKKSLNRIAHEIIERNKDSSDLVIIGIQRRGVYLAKRIANKIKSEDSIDIPIGSLNINFYNDNLTTVADQPVVKDCSINFSINNKKIILVDDVLYSGHTIKSAIDTILSIGKPSSIQLAVLIDRGHKELPISADYLGKAVTTQKDEVVHVKVLEVDGTDEVVVNQIKTSILM